MYVLAEGREAVLVDPQPSEQAAKRLSEDGVRSLLLLLTHEHFDHASGIPFWRERYDDVRVIAHACCAASLAIAKNNRPLALLKMITPQNREEILRFYRSFPVREIAVDETWQKHKAMRWQGHEIVWEEAPGHSPGSCLIFIDGSVVFTGDSLIPDIPVILRYPGASRQAYEEATLPLLRQLPKEICILPGHGEGCRMSELHYLDGCFCHAGRKNRS